MALRLVRQRTARRDDRTLVGHEETGGHQMTTPREGANMRKAVIYTRVSTQDQTTANQERELRAVAERMGCEVVRVYTDHGISGAKGRNGRPAFDAMCK